MTSSGHTACRRAIGEHFEARISPAREQQMRRHLAECATCREHYELHLALAEIDPKGLFRLASVSPSHDLSEQILPLACITPFQGIFD